jgi:hypothetical protein
MYEHSRKKFIFILHKGFIQGYVHYLYLLKQYIFLLSLCNLWFVIRIKLFITFSGECFSYRINEEWNLLLIFYAPYMCICMYVCACVRAYSNSILAEYLICPIYYLQESTETPKYLSVMQRGGNHCNFTLSECCRFRIFTCVVSVGYLILPICSLLKIHHNQLQILQ